jgi:hypothetical protein
MRKFDFEFDSDYLQLKRMKTIYIELKSFNFGGKTKLTQKRSVKNRKKSYFRLILSN